MPRSNTSTTIPLCTVSSFNSRSRSTSLNPQSPPPCLRSRMWMASNLSTSASFRNAAERPTLSLVLPKGSWSSWRSQKWKSEARERSSLEEAILLANPSHISWIRRMPPSPSATQKPSMSKTLYSPVRNLCS